MPGSYNVTLRTIQVPSATIARHMWNGPAGKSLFRHSSSGKTVRSYVRPFSRGRGPLASMKFAMRGVDQSDAL